MGLIGGMDDAVLWLGELSGSLASAEGICAGARVGWYEPLVYDHRSSCELSEFDGVDEA